MVGTDTVGAIAAQVTVEIGDVGAGGTGLDQATSNLSATDPLTLNNQRLKVPRKNSAQLRATFTARTLGSHVLVLVGYTT